MISIKDYYGNDIIFGKYYWGIDRTGKVVSGQLLFSIGNNNFQFYVNSVGYDYTLFNYIPVQDNIDGLIKNWRFKPHNETNNP